jgi:phosphodiester glycosidase/IPT/TIG domain-containing protein
LKRAAVVLAVALVSGCAPAATAPTIASVTPASGAPGAGVVIAGANLEDAREVTFGGAPAEMTSIGADRIVVRVPTDAASGPVVVRTTSGTATFPVFVVSAPVTVAVDPPSSPSVATGLGYSYVSVSTARGTFGVYLIKERLTDVTVKTVTANTVVCRNDCPAKPLADYARAGGAYAGINGTYLCPPDYAECAGKVNTYDYAVYNSDLATWLNLPALMGQNAVVTFAGSAATFYRRAYVYGQARLARNIPITAGISNYPLLLQGGAVVDSEREQSATQQERNTKGAIGVDATNIYLALVANATVTEAAYALQALGVRDAMNLDGGGTSAMWIGGSYKVGPGRLLPNAILLVRQ